MTEQQAKGAPKGPGSFCVPRAAVEALRALARGGKAEK